LDGFAGKPVSNINTVVDSHMTQQKTVPPEDLLNHPHHELVLREVKKTIPSFINDQLSAVVDLPIVTELQIASTEMCSALDFANSEAVEKYWLEFMKKFMQVKTAYHEAAHAVVGYRLRNPLNRKILRICIDAQKAEYLGLVAGFVEFENLGELQNRTEAQAKLAMILAGYLNEPYIESEDGSIKIGGSIGPNDGDTIQKDEIMAKWFMGTKKTRQRAMEEATREATWVGQRDAITALARTLLLEPTLELNEQAAYEFLSNRPELKC
jgi:hypothetical protein